MGKTYRPAIILPTGALVSATRELLTLPDSTFLKLAAGEHLAAAFLSCLWGLPSAFDSHGESDLAFEAAPSGPIYVEIKSYPGEWRRRLAKMEIGHSHTLQIVSAAAILKDLAPQLASAALSLRAKLADQQEAHSRAIFLIVNWLDAASVEAMRGDIDMTSGLPALEAPVDLEYVFVLWHPLAMTMWRTSERRWTQVYWGFTTDPEAEPPSPDEELRAVDDLFVGARGASESPWFIDVRPKG